MQMLVLIETLLCIQMAQLLNLQAFAQVLHEIEHPQPEYYNIELQDITEAFSTYAFNSMYHKWYNIVVALNCQEIH